jgi:hypothetical protein
MNNHFEERAETFTMLNAPNAFFLLAIEVRVYENLYKNSDGPIFAGDWGGRLYDTTST